MRIGLAFRAFFAVLLDRLAADRISAALARETEIRGDGDRAAVSEREEKKAAPPKVDRPQRRTSKSEALILLEVLQREGRLIDFLKESISEYNDAQIGAAVRDIHRDCGAALERLFAIRPAVDQEEGQTVEVAGTYDSGVYRLFGNVVGSGPYRGVIRHHGWKATECNMPTWTGTAEAAQVIAPAEIEVAP